ncbi:MAG: hypothetical protein ACNYPH_00410 [Gammaproteobacteria bacterium WSBS_2016_MAG_OTU1]
MNSPPNASPSEVVRNLLQVISQQLPMSAADELLAENLQPHMDGKKIGHGKKSWFKWVQFLHENAAKKVTALTIEIDSINEKGHLVEVQARWSGVHNGAKILSSLGTVVYEVQDGKIINVWTHRANYTFIYGDAFANNPLAFYWVIMRLIVWTPPVDSIK